MKFLAGMIVTIAVIILAILGGVYSGIYNIAATRPHDAITSWVLHEGKHHSVERHAEGIEAPASFSDAQVRQGARHFSQSCVHCHGAPGAKPGEWSEGLRPEPPELAKAARHWPPNQLFWIVKNGIRMTGMPAFGGDHGEADIWALVAFVKALPGMSAGQYGEMTTSGRQNLSSDHAPAGGGQ